MFCRGSTMLTTTLDGPNGSRPDSFSPGIPDGSRLSPSEGKSRDKHSGMTDSRRSETTAFTSKAAGNQADVIETPIRKAIRDASARRARSKQDGGFFAAQPLDLFASLKVICQ